MPEDNWSWNEGSVARRLALAPATIGTNQPRTVLEVPASVLLRQSMT